MAEPGQAFSCMGPARSLSSISSLSLNTNELNEAMQTGVSAAVAAMEQAVRRLDAALAQRGAAFRSLADQHGRVAAELKAAREELSAVRAEAGSLRERAALVDALREELAQMQQDEVAAQKPAPAASAADDTALRAALAAKDREITALKTETQDLRQKLASAVDAKVALQEQAVRQLTMSGAVHAAANGSGNATDVAALKAELAAARAAQSEMQAFQSGVAARLEATMARLRQALDADIHA
jgi:chromosome segregation ATPase